ncbi:hypothetical protein SAMN04488034_103211 [Salinimicrobium catena]|uniref:Uncharacterized protein n=1 Tax=Salinimicrobium catena TaxID=390640 RepID=A0A1H5MYX6_9FLAO|nr:hypothetical protein [Salinimicrobium catena]SDL32981.1 hypothetical protein SAMN04488140_103211 [Salinimicrobium catena]SEE94579.1 hypothetical protein SAMN04488034_103211 [Salinimicrobium catena]
MKRSFLTFAVIAMVLTFTSCKETPAESTQEGEVEVMETPAETTIEAVETPAEEVVDTTAIMAEDNVDTTSVE